MMTITTNKPNYNEILTTTLTLLTNQFLTVDNTIKISDFKVIVNKEMNTWQFGIYGPDNVPMSVTHPKLKFQSEIWNIKKKSSAVPWFISELPDKFFVLICRWWIKVTAYVQWKKENKPNDYKEILLLL